MTPIGWLVVPTAILIFLLRPVYLLPLMVIASVFELSTVYNGAIGQFIFGVSVFSFVQILILFRLLLSIAGRWKELLPETSQARSIAVPLVAFLAWSFVSALLMPRIFAGTTIVSPRESADGYFVLAPLEWSWSNMAQAVYLALNVSTLLYALLVVKTKGESHRLVTAFRAAVMIVTAAALLQIVSPSSYPYKSLITNPSEYTGSDQEIEGFHRVTGTFGEPSSGGSFLAAAAIGLLASYLRGKRGVLSAAGLGVVVVALVYTTSTTGYITFAFGACFLLIYFRQSLKEIRRGWIAVLAVPFIVFAMDFNSDLYQALLAVTVDKTDTGSTLARLVGDASSLDVFTHTWGIGAGLGSSRSSSLVPTALSTVGVVGVYLVVLALRGIVRLFPGKSAPSSVQLTFWAFAALLLAGAIGFPEINRPPLWALFIVVSSQLNVYATNRAMIPERDRSHASEVRVSLEGTTGAIPAN
jgi:O-Antigen ligase